MNREMTKCDQVNTMDLVADLTMNKKKMYQEENIQLLITTIVILEYEADME